MSAVAMQSFGFGEQLVRITDRDGEPWFVGKDVCEALEIRNAADALTRLDDDERDVIGLTDVVGRKQEMVIISESGMFSLVLGSRKESAKAFKRWVTREVLPSLRKTGRYEMLGAENDQEPPSVVPTLLLNTRDDIDRLRAKASLMRETRLAYGVKAARKLWGEMGLPDLSEPVVDATLAPPAVWNAVNQSAMDWMSARVQLSPGTRVPTMVLYNDYLDWSKREGRHANDILTLTAFGRYLSICGLPSRRSNATYRVGVRLVTQS